MNDTIIGYFASDWTPSVDTVSHLTVRLTPFGKRLRALSNHSWMRYGPRRLIHRIIEARFIDGYEVKRS